MSPFIPPFIPNTQSTLASMVSPSTNKISPSELSSELSTVPLIDDTGSHVRFDNTTWWNHTLAPIGIVSPVNNQKFYRQWWNRLFFEQSSIGSEDATAFSNVICGGYNNCNTARSGDTNLGRVQVYVTNLQPGKYEVTYQYNATFKTNKGSAGASIVDGSGKYVLPENNPGGNVGSGPGTNHQTFNTGFQTRTVTVTVGNSGEALVADYTPKVATPNHGAKYLNSNFAEARAKIGIVRIKNVITK